jgi:hypothetical protein
MGLLSKWFVAAAAAIDCPARPVRPIYGWRRLDVGRGCDHAIVASLDRYRRRCPVQGGWFNQAQESKFLGFFVSERILDGHISVRKLHSSEAA